MGTGHNPSSPMIINYCIDFGSNQLTCDVIKKSCFLPLQLNYLINLPVISGHILAGPQVGGLFAKVGHSWLLL